MFNFINKEQRKNFDSLVVQLPLSFNVRQNRFTNLDAAQLLLADFTDYIAGIDFDTVQELDRIITTVNRLDYKVVAVFLHAIGLIVEIESNSNSLCDFANTGGTFRVELNGCSRISLRQIDALQIDIAFRRCTSGFRNTFDSNLLNQALIVGFHRIQAIDHVIDTVRLMGGRIAQGQQGVKLAQALLRLLAFDRLRLIYNKNRIGPCNNVDRTTGAELIQLHVDTTRIFSLGIECLGIDNHYIDGAIG